LQSKQGVQCYYSKIGCKHAQPSIEAKLHQIREKREKKRERKFTGLDAGALRDFFLSVLTTSDETAKRGRDLTDLAEPKESALNAEEE
jgi:hypothetical protein